MTEVGKPLLFDIDKYCDTVEGLILSDEVECAIMLLDNPPSYFRQYPTERMLEIRESLERQLWTPCQYRNIYAGLGKSTADYAPHLLRGKLLIDLVQSYNKQGMAPHVMELAPGGLALDEALRRAKCVASYESMSLDSRVEAGDVSPSAPTIFLALELIEHLSEPQEIYRNYLKFNRNADVVMLSTPLHTFAGGMGGWRTRELGHLRAYTPDEMVRASQRLFKDRQWECYLDDTIVCIGRINS